MLQEISSSSTLQAWWFRYGDSPIDTNGLTHIAFIINNPDMFGLTKEYIEDLYKQHNEHLGQEGQAREQLVREAVNSGWVRARHHVSRDNYWSFTVNDVQSKRRDIVDFCWYMIEQKKMSENDSISIVSLRDKNTQDYSFNLGGVKAFLNEKKNSVLNNILKEFKIKEQIVPYKIKESSLSRLLSKMQEHDCAIITAFKSNYSYKQNKARNKVLLAELIYNNRYRVTSVMGASLEGTKEVQEDSYFIEDYQNTNNLEKDCFESAEKWQQYSVIFIPKEAIQAKLYGTSKESDAYIPYEKFQLKPILTIGTVSEFMTKIKGRPFSFKSLGESIVLPEDRIARMTWQGGTKSKWEDIVNWEEE